LLCEVSVPRLQEHITDAAVVAASVKRLAGGLNLAPPKGPTQEG